MKYKKSLKLTLAIVAMALFTVTATAQKKRNTDNIAQAKTERLAKQLGLNNGQKNQLLVLNKKLLKDMKTKGKNKANGKVAYKDAVKKILTPEQYQKWEARHSGV